MTVEVKKTPIATVPQDETCPPTAQARTLAAATAFAAPTAAHVTGAIHRARGPDDRFTTIATARRMIRPVSGTVRAMAMRNPPPISSNPVPERE